MYDNKKLSLLEEEILYKFTNVDLLITALNHPSILKFSDSKNQNTFIKKSLLGSYEKLEFIGDKVLNFIIAEALYHFFPDEKEGDLSIKLNYLVSGKVIAEIGLSINILKYINMSFGLKRNNVNFSKRMIEDCVEAIIGAIYLDGGFEKTRRSIMFLWGDRIKSTNYVLIRDFKTLLQERVQKNGNPSPKYSLIKTEGSDHEPVFFIELDIGIEKKFYGQAKSIKAGQSQAAEDALKFLDNNK